MLWNAKNGSVPVGGTEISYVSFGHGRKTLILLPGLSDGLATVKNKALLLAPSYRLFFEKYTVYMFSRRDALPEGFSIRDMAEDQAEAMKALRIRKAAVLGVSQGGMIAQYLAVYHPDLVSRLVLAVSAPSAGPLTKDCLVRWIGFAEKKDHRQLMIDTAERSYSPAYLKKYRMLYPVIGRIGKPSDYGRFLANAEAILQVDASGELGKISCPTLVIGGTDDRIVGVQASYALAGNIKDSRLILYRGLGHAAYEEAPDFNRRVYDFLEEEI